MKKLLTITFFMMAVILTACSSGKLNFSVEKAPLYKADESFPIIIKVTDGDELVTGLEMTTTLEMAKMDHGTIEVTFTETADGLYEGEVALPMGGEWIASVSAMKDSKTYKDVITFNVIEE